MSAQEFAIDLAKRIAGESQMTMLNNKPFVVSSTEVVAVYTRGLPKLTAINECFGEVMPFTDFKKYMLESSTLYFTCEAHDENVELEDGSQYKIIKAVFSSATKTLKISWEE